MIERAVALAGSDRLEVDDLPPALLGGYEDIILPSIRRRDTLRDWAGRYARLVLERCHNNKRRACRELGISYLTLQRTFDSSRTRTHGGVVRWAASGVKFGQMSGSVTYRGVSPGMFSRYCWSRMIWVAVMCTRVHVPGSSGQIPVKVGLLLMAAWVARPGYHGLLGCQREVIADHGWQSTRLAAC